MTTLVSIIMPARNSEKYIGQAIQSVIRQTHPNWELLIVDDGSADGTLKLALDCAKQDPRIRVMCIDQAMGPARARNLAIFHANGRFIAFLDSDDIWLPNKLELQIERMVSSRAALSFTGYKKIDRDGNLGESAIQVPSTVTYAELLKTNVIACLTAVYDVQALGKMYMPEDSHHEARASCLARFTPVRHHEDYALWLAILRRIQEDHYRLTQTEVVGLNEVLAYYRIHNQSVSSNKFRAATMQWAVYRRFEKLSLWKSLFYLLHYAYQGYRKTRLS